MGAVVLNCTLFGPQNYLIMEQLPDFSLGRGECMAVGRAICTASSQARGPTVVSQPWLSCHAHHFSEQSGFWLASHQATHEGGSKRAAFVQTA